MKTHIKIYLIAFSLFVTGSIQAQNISLNIGDIVKPFSAKADNGEVWESKNAIGKKNLVVYFYPAAMTGGCTKQACAYRDTKDELSSLNAEVVGISGDAVENLKLFKTAHALNFTLLSDPEGLIASQFGVPVSFGEKSIEREVDGITHILSRDVTTARWTFVFDKEGKLIYKSTSVDAAEDSKLVVDVLKKLSD
ncbi:MAG: peroxiredoxin [Bacteroidales bacterium]|nr:peroxiredoxin [Bacteroidales bacterium]MCF8391409.1 peroxiredoxin [Bacteroidales bacterium]